MKARHSDTVELADLLRKLDGVPKNPFSQKKGKGFRFNAPWCVKACTLYHAHLQRVPVPESMLEGTLLCGPFRGGERENHVVIN